MADIISDEQIMLLLRETKELPYNWRVLLHLKKRSESKSSQAQLEIMGSGGTEFILFVRQNTNWPKDFSVGLRAKMSDGNRIVLVRHNGSSHRHVNHVERAANRPDYKFTHQFHIHKATERYQRAGRPIDGYAEPTTQFSDCEQALEYMAKNYGFQILPDPNGQMELNLS